MPSSSQAPPRTLILLLAASCGLVVANLYYVQPLVGLIAPAVHLPPRSASLMVTLTQLGYAAGLLLLVPLADMLENRRLITIMVASTIPSLLLLCLATNAGLFLLGAALIGITSVAVQMMVPMAAHLAPDAMRGRVVGSVMSGLLAGILFSRPIASFVASLAGWRMVFLISACAMALLAILLRLCLPEVRPGPGHRYHTLLASLLTLPFHHPELRRHALCQAACFAAFSLFWTGTPLWLAHLGLGQAGIGLFALAGAAGALMAPCAGRLADSGYGRIGSLLSLLAVAFAFVLAAIARNSILLLVVAGVLLDAGVQAHLIFCQREIYRLDPAARARLNGIFMATFFLGGAAGSAATSTLLVDHGFTTLACAGSLLPLAALAYTATVTFFSKTPPHPDWGNSVSRENELPPAV